MNVRCAVNAGGGTASREDRRTRRTYNAVLWKKSNEAKLVSVSRDWVAVLIRALGSGAAVGRRMLDVQRAGACGERAVVVVVGRRGGILRPSRCHTKTVFTTI